MYFFYKTKYFYNQGQLKGEVRLKRRQGVDEGGEGSGIRNWRWVKEGCEGGRRRMGRGLE